MSQARGAMPSKVSRRDFLLEAGAILAAPGELASADPAPAPVPRALMTPYKLNQLVLRGSGVAGDFDEKFVDCPFVFRYENEFNSA
jgi:hypothetical protein